MLATSAGLEGPGRSCAAAQVGAVSHMQRGPRICVLSAVWVVATPARAEPEPWSGASAVLAAPNVDVSFRRLQGLGRCLPSVGDALLNAGRIDSAEGLDRDRGAWVVWTPDGSLVAVVGVRDPEKVGRALDDRGARRIDSNLWVFGPTLDAGACRLSNERLVCQTPVRDRASFARAERLARDAPPLPAASGPWSFRAWPRRFVPFVRRTVRRYEAREAGWVSDDARRRARERADARLARWTTWLVGIRSVELSTDRAPGSFRGRVRFDEATGRKVSAWLGTRQPDARVVGWAQTPALLQLWARLEPAAAQRLAAAWTGQPADDLDGDFGLLWFGVRPRCTSGCPSSTGTWSQALPAAAAFSVRDDAPGRDRAPNSEPPALIVGSDPVARAAALRRWGAARPVPPSSPSVAHLRLDLDAVRAVLDAHAASDDPIVRQVSLWLDWLAAGPRSPRYLDVDVTPDGAREYRLAVSIGS